MALFIKYKGQTGSLLRDISMVYKIPVNLKISEVILAIFFKQIIKDLNHVKAIEFICNLPPFLKPFCELANNHSTTNQILGMDDKIALNPILKILEKYVSQEKMTFIYASLPNEYFLITTNISYYPHQDAIIFKVS